MLEKIIDGLAVAGIIWLLKFLFKNVPVLLDHLTYKSVKIEGKWKTKITDHSYTEEVTIKRFGYKIWGTIKCLKSPKSADNGKEYKFKGTFKDRLLVGDYQLQDSSGSIDPGCFLLELVDGGKKLKGFSLIYQHSDDELMPVTYEWVRT